MYDYVTEELPAIIENNFPVSDVKSISGHSMGGHGAITITNQYWLIKAMLIFFK